jgi:hypothetical protein
LSGPFSGGGRQAIESFLVLFFKKELLFTLGNEEQTGGRALVVNPHMIGARDSIRNLQAEIQKRSI